MSRANLIGYLTIPQCAKARWLVKVFAVPMFSFHGLALGSPGNWDEKGLTTLTTVGTLYSPVASVEWSSDKTSDISRHDRKIILLALDDALAFVASSGEVRGAMLEQALGLLRGIGVKGQDVHLATMIIASAEVVSR